MTLALIAAVAAAGWFFYSAYYWCDRALKAEKLSADWRQRCTEMVRHGKWSPRTEPGPFVVQEYPWRQRH